MKANALDLRGENDYPSDSNKVVNSPVVNGRTYAVQKFQVISHPLQKLI